MPKKRNKRYVHDLTCPKGHPDEAYFETCNCGATQLNKGLKMAKKSNAFSEAKDTLTKSHKILLRENKKLLDELNHLKAQQQLLEDTEISLVDLIKTNKPMASNELKLVRRWIDADWESNDIDRDAITLIKRLLTTCEDLEKMLKV